MEELPEHVEKNRNAWDTFASDYVETGERNWRSNEPVWGIFNIPEAQVGMLPANLTGLDVVELGCGTAYLSSWLARRGARPVGIDNSPAQLETARRLQQEHGLSFPLHLGNAEQTPFADASFDFAISEYGASIWCDPYKWIPEAARILRPGGELTFMVNGLILMLCTGADGEDPVSIALERPLFGIHRLEWVDGSVEFHLPHGEWIKLLRSSGFEILELNEIQIPADATTRYPYVNAEWAHKWPAEEVWKARKQR